MAGKGFGRNLPSTDSIKELQNGKGIASIDRLTTPAVLPGADIVEYKVDRLLKSRPEMMATSLAFILPEVISSGFDKFTALFRHHLNARILRITRYFRESIPCRKGLSDIQYIILCTFSLKM